MPLTIKIKNILISALDMKEASIKRAQNTNKSPNFAAVYDLERAELAEARTYVTQLAPEDDKKK